MYDISGRNKTVQEVLNNILRFKEGQRKNILSLKKKKKFLLTFKKSKNKFYLQKPK